MEDSVVGCLTYDFKEDEHNFTLQKTGTIMNRGSAGVETYGLASPVNDFCFTPDKGKAQCTSRYLVCDSV